MPDEIGTSCHHQRLYEKPVMPLLVLRHFATILLRSIVMSKGLHGPGDATRGVGTLIAASAS